MSATGLEVFDKSIQTTNIWLNEISEEIGPDRKLAWRALGVVLRTLRDRLPADEAAHLAAQLPLVVRGAYYDQYRPALQPVPLRSREEFVECVAGGLEGERPVDPDAVTRTVLTVVGRHIDAGEVEQLRQSLPKAIRTLWPDGQAREQ
ncbi:DUF2267 domain-containing protein [Chelatococcus sp. GCM10030263]|uniref:DUF2267 domain-containing protein n=1 Tax=Chelatococcus sp. GCM10030263 TaxID=3273387 RepID=UPI0036083058